MNCKNSKNSTPLTYEGAFITLQNIAVIFLILVYGGKSGVSGVLMTLALGGLGAALLQESLVSDSLLLTLQWSTVFMGIASKIPQVILTTSFYVMYLWNLSNVSIN
jgi:hypothetical protein